MGNLSKAQRDKNKQDFAKKNFRYNRYFALRYSLALFFFSNLYWFIFTRESGLAWMIPASLILLGAPAAVEHVKLYGDKSKVVNEQLKFNQLYHYIQTAVNLAMILVVMTRAGYSVMFPFLTTVIEARLTMAAVLLVGALLSLFCIKRISRIKANTDKYYARIKELEHAMPKAFKNKLR